MNIFSYLYQPPITSSVVAVILSVGLVAGVWMNKAAIAKVSTAILRKTCNRNGFFWLVCVIFMSVSVLHAGIFFGITGNAHDIPGVAQYLGFAVSFFLDLVTIILMQALLEARYRSDEARAKQFLFFIVICCSTSTFANLAISLNDFDPKKFLPHAPVWIQIAAPYVLASFPLFVILMSVAAEMIINVRPLDSLNEDEYEADEKKRIRLLQIRNDYLQKQADEELRALTIRATMQMNKRMRSGKLPKSFRWFWEKPIDIDAVIAGVSAQLQATYEPRIEQLKQRLEEVEKPIIPPALPTWIPTENPPVPDTLESTSKDVGNNGNTTDTASGKTPQKAPSSTTVATIPGGRRSVTVKEAAQILGLSDSYVRDLRKNGTLKRSSSNPNLIVMSSVLAYQEARQNAGKNADSFPLVTTEQGTQNAGKNADSFPLMTTEQGTQKAFGSDEKIDSKPATNGRSKETQPLDNLVLLESETDPQLAIASQ